MTMFMNSRSVATSSPRYNMKPVARIALLDVWVKNKRTGVVSSIETVHALSLASRTVTLDDLTFRIDRIIGRYPM